MRSKISEKILNFWPCLREFRAAVQRNNAEAAAFRQAMRDGHRAFEVVIHNSGSK
jgi:hypothetical protein